MNLPVLLLLTGKVANYKKYKEIMTPKIKKEIAEEMLQGILDDLGIDMDDLSGDEDEKTSIKKIVSSIMYGRLKYENEIFTQTLLKPIKKGDKQITEITICEPEGVQLRGMAQVKKNNDDVGKAMAILGEVTKLGLPVIQKLKSRDLMVAVGVISLFL
jgi:hypothetical protein